MTLGESGKQYPFDRIASELQSSSDIWLRGVLALEQGAIFTSTILAAMTVALIERKHFQAGLWCMAAALLSTTGFMHGFEWRPISADAVNVLGFAWTEWTTGYAIMAACFFLAPVLTEPGEGH
jgi:adenine/guanine/hypoxanthine permease